MNYSKYNGKRIEEVAKHRKDLSLYCRNYYEDNEGGLIYVWSDDDNYSEYTEISVVNNVFELKRTFAESFTDNGDLMMVFSEFM